MVIEILLYMLHGKVRRENVLNVVSCLSTWEPMITYIYLYLIELL